MSQTTWRDTWPAFRLAVVDETARCLANQLAADTGEAQAAWEALSRRERMRLIEHVAGVMMAQDGAIQNLAERGLPF